MHRFLSNGMLAVLTMTVSAHVAAQDGATALQRNYQTLLDNEQMQVVRVHYDPHEKLPTHDHSHYPTVYVYLSNSGPVRFMHNGAAPFTLTRRAVRTGWFRVSPGRIETHQVTNLGPLATDFLRVECKRIPLGRISEGFRYSKDVDLTKTSVVTDYASTEMVIQRYVVTSGNVKRIVAETQGELLIAFTPVIVHEQGNMDRRMAAGPILWIRAHANAELRPAGATAAHILAIRLLN